METIAFSAFQTKLLAEAFPDGAPENLLGSLRQFSVDGLIDLQRCVECLKDTHTDIVPWADTLFKCGVTVFDAPRGIIRKVTLVADAEYCDPIRYHQRNMDTLNCWSRRFMDMVTDPPNANRTVLPLGFKYPESSTDSPFGRALRGLWAIDGVKLYVAPWIQSNESALVEWSGLKRKYADTDLIPDEDDLRRAVRLWVQKEFARDFEKDYNSAKAAEIEYNALRGELMLECREERRTRQDVTCQAEIDAVSFNQTTDDTTEEEDVTEDTVTVFAAIGDYGEPGAPADDVAAEVKTWNPEFIVSLGDNNYPAGEADTIDAAIGRNWRKFIYPYLGSESLKTGETDATENCFFPVPGNHDADNATGDPLQPYLEYFTLPDANERYYTFRWGHVEFFMMWSGLNTAGDQVEPDGGDAYSIQAEYMLLKIAQSTARWKVGVVHHCPYSSATSYTPGISIARWPYRQMGLDVLLSGHGHVMERLEIDDFPYLVCGNSGHSLVGFGDPPVSGSQFRYNEDHGAIRGTATCDSLVLEMVTRTGVVLDTLTLT